MNWFNLKDVSPALDEKVWFRVPGHLSEAYAVFLGWTMNKKPCFRSSTGRIVEVSDQIEWRHNQPERLNPEAPKGDAIV